MSYSGTTEEKGNEKRNQQLICIVPYKDNKNMQHIEESERNLEVVSSANTGIHEFFFRIVKTKMH